MNEPHPTLYIANIDWKIKAPVLKRALHTLFNRHGKIIDIIALRRDGLRGQAFVIFDDAASATAALRAEQGFTFFGKDLKIEYANEKSDRVAKKDGTFVPKDRRAKRTLDDKDDKDSKKLKVEVESKSDGLVQVDDPSKLEAKTTAEDVTPPSNILFADDLPQDCNEMMLSCLFGTYVGYKEVRVPRPGLAFIEFESEPHATVALKALNEFKLSANDTLAIKYAKSN